MTAIGIAAATGSFVPGVRQRMITQLLALATWLSVPLRPRTAQPRAAFLSVTIFGLAHAPSVFAVHALSAARVAASALAILLGTFAEVALDAAHPPAASTTLLAALGSFKRTWGDAALVIGGVLIVTVVGEAGRRLQLAALRRERAARATESDADGTRSSAS